MMAFGMDLSHSAAKELSENWVGAIPYLVLILMVTASSYIQQLQISARNKNGTAINPQQAMLLKIMPAFFAVISLTLPAGIVVYFLVSNLYRIGQRPTSPGPSTGGPQARRRGKGDPGRGVSGQAEARAQGGERPRQSRRRRRHPPVRCRRGSSRRRRRAETGRSQTAAEAEVVGSDRATSTEAGLRERERHRGGSVDRARRRRTRQEEALRCSGSRPPARRWRKH
jgi:hypothetical protein